MKEGLGAGLKIHNKVKSASSINAKKLLQRASKAAVKSGIHQVVDEYHKPLTEREKAILRKPLSDLPDAPASPRISAEGKLPEI